MAIQNQITPRKEVGRAVDYLSPSTQVQVGGGPQSFSVSASKSVTMPTPYVGRAAKNTELLELAESLGMFNKQINALSYVVTNKAEEQAKAQGEEDAMANTELAREIFKRNMDQATKDGLFPRNAHPAYRTAYIETGAKAATIQGLTEFLDENTVDLTSANNMEPIGPQIRNRANQWIFDNIQDPLARAAAMKQAFPIVQQYEQRRRGEREANFNESNEQSIGQLGMGLVEVIASNSVDYEDNVQNMNRLDAIQNLQKLYDTTVRNHPEFNGKQSIMVADMVTASLQSQVRNGSIDPRQAIKVVNELSQSIKSGTAAWGDIPDVASRLNGAITYFENQAVQRDSMGKARQSAQMDVMESATQNLFRELDDSGELIRMDEGQLVAKISELASANGIPELANDPFIFLDDQRNEYFERKSKWDKMEMNLGPQLEEKLRDDPESALADLKAMKSSISVAAYNDWRERITNRLNVTNDLKIGRFDDKLRDVERQANNLLSAQEGLGPILGGSLGVKQDEVVRVAELTQFGESEFRMLATDNIEQRLQAEPTLKEPERATEYTAVVNEAVGAAYTETLKRMEDRKKQMDAEKEVNGENTNNQELITTYGKGARMVSEATDALKSITALDPDGETTAETAEFKLTIDRAKRQLPSLAKEVKLATGETKTQLQNTYLEMRKITGLGVDAVISGKTEDGISLDLSTIAEEQGWDTIPVFRDIQELSTTLNDDIQAGKQGGESSGSSLVDFVIREEAGADGSSFYPTPKWDYKRYTIGYGTEAKGPNDRVTPTEAKQRLKDRLEESAISIDGALDEVGLILNENQRNALISFDFNTGEGRRKILESKGDIEYIKSEMAKFINVTPDPKRPERKVVAEGLVARRQRELDLFNGVTQPTQAPSKTKLEQLLEKLGIKINADEVSLFIDAQKLLINQRTFNTSQ